MMDQSGHKSIDTLCGYVRDAKLFKDHAGTGLLYVVAADAVGLREVQRHLSFKPRLCRSPVG